MLKNITKERKRSNGNSGFHILTNGYFSTWFKKFQTSANEMLVNL
jgi:hypothetical protein